jgi:hypothetical protein
MGKGLPRSLSRGGLAGGAVAESLVIPVQALTISVAGTVGVGWGTAVLRGLPTGNVMLLGCVANLTFSGPAGGSADLVDTWNGDFGLGTTPADDGTITLGDVDLVPSTAVGPAVAEVSPRTQGVQPDGSLCGVIFDNSAGTLEINLNLLIDDADISGDVDMTADGDVHIAYIMLGSD